jgi:hypothetical protein
MEGVEIVTMGGKITDKDGERGLVQCHIALAHSFAEIEHEPDALLLCVCFCRLKVGIGD